ncbi:hypothetical protein DPMN_167701 [Dreissena polymorpha]|uniref:Uncharacterized protein n=1 Tax=Dreissena polymorpha TaxID=45954 RepID=A0A9D4F3R7_DREPO|nr:hypothetical protein DPMN_167701 [Dreissena polymorpha]
MIPAYKGSGGHVFQLTGTIFKLITDSIRTNFLTKFHKDQTIHVASRPCNENAPPPCGHVFQPTGTIFEPVQDKILTNLLTKSKQYTPSSSKGGIINVASRVLTRKIWTSHDAEPTMDKRRSQKLPMSTLCSGVLSKS